MMAIRLHSPIALFSNSPGDLIEFESVHLLRGRKRV